MRPEATTITYSHATFTVRQHVLAPLDEPGLLVLLEVDTWRPLEIVASFRAALQYAWPAGLGGQYASWSEADRAFVLSESLRRRNALVGSPWATRASSHPAHALPDAPSTFTIPVDPGRAAREMVPIAIAAGTGERAETVLAYRRLLSRAREIYDARVRHAAALREGGLRVDTPDDRLDLALEWAKVNLDEQTVCNPDLGCGLVAGWGPSGDGARPGFGWFFGGDAAINSFAMAATGQWAPAADGLRFLAKYQRADGKIPHEVSQAAGVIPWFDEYPYAYYHADTTPFWLLAALAAVEGERRRGACCGELWPAARKAWAWCLPHDTDGDGIIENTTGGLGAIEVGAIGEDIHQDVYLAAVWTRAAGAMAEMAAARGEPAPRRGGARPRGEGPRLDRVALLDRERGPPRLRRPALRHGRTTPSPCGPPPPPRSSLFEPAHAARTLAALSRARAHRGLGGPDALDREPALRPAHYNMGAVWPFVTGFVALGHYQYARPWAGYPLVDALSRMAFDWARGRHPELLSGAYYRPLDTAVPHQFFATSMLVSPVAYGLLGFEPDAPGRRARLAPQLPPQWGTVRVTGLAGGRRAPRRGDRAGARPALVEDRALGRPARARAEAPAVPRSAGADRGGRRGARSRAALGCRRGRARRPAASGRGALDGRARRRASDGPPRAGASRPRREGPGVRVGGGRLAARARGALGTKRHRSPPRPGRPLGGGRDAPVAWPRDRGDGRLPGVRPSVLEGRGRLDRSATAC